MTAQMPDRVFIQGMGFALTAVNGTGLFDPAARGLEPQGFSTGCYRGHVCRYAVKERLVLRGLELGAEEEPPPLDGVRPRQDEHLGSWRYQRLDLPVSFTGRLLVGRGYADSPVVNMGFWPAWRYAEVHDLAFRDGVLVSAEDCSAALAEVRANLPATGPAPGEPFGDWFERTFSLTYEYSWPGRPQ
ncbi:hypothetical protein JOF53_007395 [Crossiella equi]|uniref:Uncharacterized protein n=1 Tax=Crossiella equi TaxID=130796 RepID=A0ABS5APL6_9PSEU|nr:hypothetical protein [Crossiella equi]MBP2478523.1 hypothetical protein [Crossiella equi]